MPILYRLQRRTLTINSAGFDTQVSHCRFLQKAVAFVSLTVP